MKLQSFDEVDKLHDELVQKVDASKVILKFLEKRIALEEEYATQVRQLCKAQPSLGSSGTAGCFTVLVSLVCDQASTTLSNLASLTIDAISPLKSAMLQLKGDINETYTEGKKLQQERKKAYDNYKKAKCVYESVVQDSPLDKSMSAENDYKFHITYVNKSQSTYFHNQLPTIIHQFQAAETLRATKTQEALLNFVHFMSHTLVKSNEAIKIANDKLSKPALSLSGDIDKYRKFSDELTQAPSDIQFGQEAKDTEKSADFLSPSLRSILKHGKHASAKWRNSFSVLTSPSRESKKIKRQSVPAKPSACLFGTPLHLLLEHQKKTYPNLDVPYVAYYLVQHFKKIGGMQTENVFRVPGMTVEVQTIKAALEAGEFTEDLLFASVHSTASAFTTWLRELPSPLIPYYMHSHCLGPKSNEELLRIFYGLPSAHCNMLVFLLSFIGELAKTENQVKTFMNADNLSMVFTPSILRSQNSADVLTNIEKERQFVKSAIDAVDLLVQTFPVKLQIQTYSPEQSPAKM